MDPYSEATCVLKVNSKCQACKMKTVEILGSVVGIFNVGINNEEGLATVHAVVDPNLFLKALSGTGPHAEPKFVNLQHPKMNYPYNHRNGYNFGPGLDPYSHRRALPQYPYHPMEHIYPQHHGSNPYYRGLNPNYHGSNPHYCGPGLPPPRRRDPFQF